MDEHLAHRLEAASAKLHRRKNGIIVRAIEEYLDSHTEDLLKDEARAQSLLVSRAECLGDDAWEQSHDRSGWEA